MKNLGETRNCVGRGLLDAPRAAEGGGPYGQKRTGIFVGAAPCGRPRAHNVRPYGRYGPYRAGADSPRQGEMSSAARQKE